MAQIHYRRITKRQARLMFEEGNPFHVIAHKLRPGAPYMMGMDVYPSKWKLDNRDFDFLVREFNYYNASWETGYYPAYYVVYATK